MTRLRIDLAYEGGAFHGWARQNGLRTVQGKVEEALSRLLRLPGLIGPGVAGESRGVEAFPFSGERGAARRGEEAWRPRLVVAGRTDTGVHALGQVCHVDLPQKALSAVVGHMDVPAPVALERRLRHLLPDDIAIHSVGYAPSGFDARFSALERTYIYRVCDDPARLDPRLRGFVLALDGRLDLEAMNQAAAAAIGLHDFGSFATPNPGGTTIREVKYARWDRAPTHPLLCEGQGPGEGPAYLAPMAESGLVCFTIVADAFAHNMVRSLVNACLKVGLGKRRVDWFQGKVAHPEREGSTGPAPACGLTLEHVAYPPDNQLASRARSIRAKRTLED
ncbi:tRNA pseudouridine synthase A [Bifidobacterium actinocoloniiforme]|uniref:tRNA pseudouridine synthase A n=1 Tax=Bifidobacterium actinocoloniiforme TaxID=638619 RepID=UPI0005297C27